MKIHKATRKYEAWLTEQVPLVRRDLALKHVRMGATRFGFFRATFYRWMQHWPELCPKLTDAPSVLAVADLHVENFGTWRDIEGRLIWGVNDFDEAAPLPYTQDLVRLAASAVIAAGDDRLGIRPATACQAVLAGYGAGIANGGRPFVLAEHHPWLRQIALGTLRDPIRFWERMDALATLRTSVPRSALLALEAALPKRTMRFRLARRVAGLGSLGRARLVAIADWDGGQIAREAKALAPSACRWADHSSSSRSFYDAILRRAIRVPDPSLEVRGPWIVRRLAPDCSRIELAELPRGRDERKLLYAMGWETANIHLGTKNARSAIARDLKHRPAGWLNRAADRMTQAVSADWIAWRKNRRD